jgi:hypothetical protein
VRRRQRHPEFWVTVTYLLAALTVAPLLWLLVTLFKPAGEIFQAEPSGRWTLANISYVLTEVPFARYLFNSALVSVMVTVVDGEPFPPSLHGSGTEDYLNTAWCRRRRIYLLFPRRRSRPRWKSAPP